MSKSSPETGRSSGSAQGAFKVAALYQFSRFDDCDAIRQRLTHACARGGIRGTIILAPEGINGTIAGAGGALDEVLAEIRTLPGCSAIAIKLSSADKMPFHRMKVKIKAEIVTMGEPAVSPLNGAGRYVEPADWNALISDPDTIIIDTRNEYEVEVGTFRNAIDPKTASFRDFPAWFRARRSALAGGKPPRIAMFCTGGIRCEKATALLKAEGLDEVYHLKGGILKYLEDVPAEQSLWQGECFVFDQRVSLAHGLEGGTFDVCHACRTPVAPADRQSPLYEPGVACPSCHSERGEEQRERYAERQRQVELAERRGARHIGPRQDAAPVDPVDD